MIINIKDRATSIKLGYSLFILIFLGLLVASLVFTFLPDYLFEIILVAAFVPLFSIYMLLDHAYLYFCDDTDKFVFRQQKLNPFITNRIAYEIPKKAFVKFEYKESFFGLKKKLILYQNTHDGVAKYKPLSLSSLKKGETQKILSVLSAATK